MSGCWRLEEGGMGVTYMEHISLWRLGDCSAGKSICHASLTT